MQRLLQLLFLLLLPLLMGMTLGLPGRASFQELRNLLREQQQAEQQQLSQSHQQQVTAQHFTDDLSSWAQSLEQLGQDFAQFVEQCRPTGTRCFKRQVLRHLRSLTRRHSELRAQLDSLEISYVGRVSEAELLTPSLRAVRRVLRQYESMLRQVNQEVYKLVNQ